MHARKQNSGTAAHTPGAATKMLALLLIALLGVPPLPAQSDGRAGEGPPTRLQIHVLTQTPLTQPTGTLSAHSLQVRITDEWGMPVRGVTVSFRLPEVGPGGAFLNGLSSEIAVSDERGEAAVQGFDWREEAGVTFVHVIAAYGAVRAGAMVEVHLVRKPVALPPEVSAAPGGTPARQPRELGQMATAESAPPAALAVPVQRAPREHTPPPPDTAYPPPMVRTTRPGQAPVEDGQDSSQDAYVRVKKGSNGGSGKLWLVLLMAGAAGGAVATSLAIGSSSGNGNSGGNPPGPPVIRIGNPTITISGAGGN